MKYDKFQLESIAHVKKGNSVIVSAPTGAGKTAIAEYVIETCIANNEGVVYTAPIKALSNQKYRDFTRKYGDRIGILTGDVGLNASAPVLIMTTEIFRNTLLENPDRFRKVTWVIFDEVHYLDDYERGTVWEESIIFCPDHIRILALSATIPNVDELATWVKKVHSFPVQIVREDHRPVPLSHRFQCNNHIYMNIEQLRKSAFPQKASRSRDRNRDRHRRSPVNRLNDLIKFLIDHNQLPALYFAFSRKRCQELAFELQSFNFLNPEETETIARMYRTLLSKHDLKEEPTAKKIWPLIRGGIAYHHAGLLPSLKEVIEQLFTSRLIKVIFTTETFALGINMPARTVIFDELRKFYGFSYDFLRHRDYYQMAGRAGRRGIDAEGFVYSRINPNRVPPERVRKIIYGKPEPVISQFNLSYATLLHLYGKWKEQLFRIYPLSLHHYQSSKKNRRFAEDGLERKLSLLRQMNYLTADGLTYKGEFAGLLYGYELPLTELFDKGILEKLSPIQLSLVLSALVFEPRKNQLHVRHDATTVDLHNKTAPVIESILKAEKKQRIIPQSKRLYFNLAKPMSLWYAGEDLIRTRAQIDIDAGEIVRYFRMVIQILRQLKTVPGISEEFRQKLNYSLQTINRDEVDAEKQLREGL